MDKFLTTVSVMGEYWPAKLVLAGGSVLSVLILLIGGSLVDGLNTQGPLRYLHEQLRAIIGPGMFLLAIAVLVVSCVLAYNACHKYIEKHT